MSDVQVRDYNEDDRSEVRRLLISVYGTAQGFDGFADGNPLGPPLAVVASDGHRLIGFNAWNRWRVEGAENLTLAQSGASAVHADARGKGIFAKLLALGFERARNDNIDAFIGFPNVNSYNSFTRAGWTTIERLHLTASVCLGIGKSQTAGLDAISSNSFAAWRYVQPGIATRSFVSDGELFFALHRVATRMSRHLVWLLDVLDARGVRRLDKMGQALKSLGASGVVLTRMSTATRQRTRIFVPVPRRWTAPVIALPIRIGEAELLGRLRGVDWLCGDIDAA